MNRRGMTNQVTPVASSSVALDGTAAAPLHLFKQINLRHALLRSDICLAGRKGSRIEKPINRLWPRTDHSHVILQHLADYIWEEPALVVQWDEIVRDGSYCHDKSFAYYHVCAVWPQFSDDCCIGYCGFTLRSRRQIEAASAVPLD